MSKPIVSISFYLLLILGSSCQSKGTEETTTSSQRPNILLAISDDQSFAHTSFAGRSWVQTKSFIIEHRNDEEYDQYFELAVGKRSEYELFDVVKGPACLSNLANDPEFTGIKAQMEERMVQELTLTEDPRVVGPDEEIFDTYPRYSGMREFPKPDWALE